jgi:hypothetical protein
MTFQHGRLPAAVSFDHSPKAGKHETVSTIFKLRKDFLLTNAENLLFSHTTYVQFALSPFSLVQEKFLNTGKHLLHVGTQVIRTLTWKDNSVPSEGSVHNKKLRDSFIQHAATDCLLGNKQFCRHSECSCK